MYAPKDASNPVIPVRLDSQSPMCFSCERDLACFTSCCHNINILLTPADIIRLKQRLELPSDEFLAIYTIPTLIEGTELPIPMLRPLEEDNFACPFVREEGCIVYEDRPLHCRYYPLGSGIFHNRDESEDERFYALIKEPTCLGHDIGDEITVQEWIEGQGIDVYDEINAGWVELILRRKSLGPFIELPEKTLQMFFMVCYNLDNFRRFVFNSRFLSVYIVDAQTQERIKNDDVALLAFGINWLKSTFFGEDKMTLRKETISTVE